MSEKNSVRGFFSGYGQIETLTYKDQAYQLLKEAVLYQKFEPDAIYSQDALCQELGISRTPVREALLELQKEGYVRFCRGKGIQIVSLDQNAIHDILEMRLYLEKVTAELAAKRATEEDLAVIADCLAQQQNNPEPDNIDRCYLLDHRFHRAIAAAAHNERLYQMLDSTLDHYLRFEMLSIYKTYAGANAILGEHALLHEAIRRHDPEMAVGALDAHLQHSYKRTLGQYWVG